MGQCRLFCLERGIPLPPIGSFQYNLILEGMRRKQSEKMAFAKLLASFLSYIVDVSEKDIALLLSDYGETIYQLKYNSQYVSLREKSEEAQVNKNIEDLQLLDKVSQFTVKD